MRMDLASSSTLVRRARPLCIAGSTAVPGGGPPPATRCMCTVPPPRARARGPAAARLVPESSDPHVHAGGTLPTTQADALAQFQELDDEIQGIRDQLRADQQDLAAFEARSASQRNSSLFFKQLYQGPADKGGAEGGAGAAAAAAQRQQEASLVDPQVRGWRGVASVLVCAAGPDVLLRFCGAGPEGRAWPWRAACLVGV